MSLRWRVWRKLVIPSMKCLTGPKRQARKPQSLRLSSYLGSHLSSPANIIYSTGAIKNISALAPGAHSHLRVQAADGQHVSQRWGNRKPVAGYVKRINHGETVVETSEMIEPRLAMGETMMLGLRLVQEGVAFERFQALHQADLREIFAEELAQLRTWQLITSDQQHIWLTRQGLMMGNQVFARFLPDMEG